MMYNAYIRDIQEPHYLRIPFGVSVSVLRKRVEGWPTVFDSTKMFRKSVNIV